MARQATGKVLMVRPCSFGFNLQTAVDNTMQRQLNDMTPQQIKQQAQQEFDSMVTLLRQEGVEVIVVQDTNELDPTPDSIFPNNWFSTHADGNVLQSGPHVCLYPMCAPNRRRERTGNVLSTLAEKCGLDAVNDMSAAENEGRFLEGTGSMVLDRVGRVAYMARSLRSDEGLFRDWCKLYSFTPVVFDAADSTGTPVYHTNVLMGLGTGYVIVCLEMIKQKEMMLELLQKSGRSVVDISEAQTRCFAGNALELQVGDQKLLVMSATGWESLREEQRSLIQNYCKSITPRVKIIETIGGGSCRCMLAELFA